MVSSLLSGLLLSRTANLSAQHQVTDQAMLMMETMNSIRDYTNSRINPLITAKYDTEQDFIPETLPTFSAREIFERVRTEKTYQNFLYKEASPNPTNLRDRADRFELGVLERFRQQPDLKETEGFRGVGQNSLFYVARPMRVAQESCLVCHSTPDRAPQSLVDTYGDQNGFNWHINELVAAQIMYVPATTVFSSYRRQFTLMMGVFVSSFLGVILLINWLLRRSVIQPIIPMARAAQRLSNEQIDTEADEAQEIAQLSKITQRHDEIGQLARLFQDMVQSICSRERTWRQTLQKLHYETDEGKQLEMLQQITGELNCKRLIERSRQVRSDSSPLRD